MPLLPPTQLGDNQGQEPLTRDRARSHQPGLDPPSSSSPGPDVPSPPAPPSSSREEDRGSLQTSLLLFLSPWWVPVPSSAPQLGILLLSLILQPQGSIMSHQPIPPGTIPLPVPIGIPTSPTGPNTPGLCQSQRLGSLRSPRAGTHTQLFPWLLPAGNLPLALTQDLPSPGAEPIPGFTPQGPGDGAVTVGTLHCPCPLRAHTEQESTGEQSHC